MWFALICKTKWLVEEREKKRERIPAKKKKDSNSSESITAQVGFSSVLDNWAGSRQLVTQTTNKDRLGWPNTRFEDKNLFQSKLYICKRSAIACQLTNYMTFLVRSISQYMWNVSIISVEWNITFTTPTWILSSCSLRLNSTLDHVRKYIRAQVFNEYLKMGQRTSYAGSNTFRNFNNFILSSFSKPLH